MNVGQCWSRYWFRPAPLVNLAVSRIVIVGTQLAWLVLASHPVKVLSRITAYPDTMYEPLPILRVMTLWGWTGWDSALVGPWNYRPSLEVLCVVCVVVCVSGFLSLIGCNTRRSLIVFAAGNVFLQAYRYSFGDYHHVEAPMMIALVVLACSPVGGALSWDDLRRRRRAAVEGRAPEPSYLLQETSVWAGWPLRLIQWVLALIYLSAAWCKINAGGLDWMNGYTLQYHLSKDGLRWGREVGVWLGQQHLLAWLLSWFTILFEATFVVAAIIPSIAWVYVVLGIAFHGGIYVTMQAPFFTYMGLYAVFIPWQRVFQSRVSKAMAGRPEVLYDGRCPLCIDSMATLRYFDWGARLRFCDVEAEWSALRGQYPQLSREACLEEMHVVLSDGSVHRGYFAFRSVLRYLPLLRPLGWLMCLPLASMVGPTWYRWIASRRVRFEQCDWDSCAVHS